MKPRFAKLDALRFGSLKLRIAVLYAALFAAVLATILLLAGDGLERFGENTATRELQANARVFDEIMELRARQMRGSADVLSRDFGFREAVATGDAPTIDSALASLKTRSGVDAAFVVGMDGTLLASGDARIADPLTLWSALDAGEDRGVLHIGDKLALGAASRIEAPDTIGWLVLGQPLDRSELDRLVELAAIDLQADVVEYRDLPQWLAATPAGTVVETEGRKRELSQHSALPTLQEGLQAQLVLGHSLDQSLARYDDLRVLLVALALGGLALVFGLSWGVARTVTQPLDKLDQATQRIGAGERVEVVIESEDEIGRLARSFNAMVVAIEEREQQIIHVGLHDGLTNLPNRKLFTEQLVSALARLDADERLMVVYIDLDDFKLVNDTLGHPAGDVYLREVASRLRSSIADSIVARLGGDEFAVLIPCIAEDTNPVSLAEQIQECLVGAIMIESQQAECSASLGIAVAPMDGSDSATLMKHADLALYRAKDDGKATYHFFEPVLDEQARQRRQMELDLRTALRDGQFELNFQPLYSLSEDRYNGFEALIRWPHPKRGYISPADFIPLAEETRLIIPIGEWVIREACRQAASWPGNLSVAVNVSPKQFSCPTLVTTILQALSSSGLEPSRLELEITESVFIANVEKTLATLHTLRNLGVRIALDDFGTGYSSLSYLRSFPFDKVKIDRSFVKDLTGGGNAHAVIRAITTLADALGMDTLAEGVEAQEQLDVLRREGCRNLQGFFFSRPVPGADVAALIGQVGRKVA